MALRRIDPRVALALVILLGTMVGCSRGDEEGPRDATEIRVIYTSNVLGEYEPCG